MSKAVPIQPNSQHSNVVDEAVASVLAENRNTANKPAFDPNAPYEAVKPAVQWDAQVDPSKFPPQSKIDGLANALVAGIAGLYGFAIGLGIWLSYRLVYFAVKG